MIALAVLLACSFSLLAAEEPVKTEAPPNGESLSDLAKRVNEFMDYLRPKKHEKVVLVTHAGVIRCIWAYLLDIPLHNVFKIPVDYDSVLRFKLGENPLFDSIK